MLKTLRRSTLAAQAARALERSIVAGDWPEGSKIPPEPRLVELLGVGRNTVREAVRALTHLGMLEARPGDGTYVRSTSLLACSLSHRLEECRLREILETRESLERQAVRLATERRTEDDLTALRDGLRALFAKVGIAPPEDVAQLAWELDLRLVRTGRNRLLLELFESIACPVQDAFLTVIHAVRGEDVDLTASHDLYRDLLSAIADRDAAAADRLVLEKNRLVRSWLPEEFPSP